MSQEIIAVLDNRVAGRVVRDSRGRLTFTYDNEWRNLKLAYPLSISMPLTLQQHGHEKIEAFLWGLLPDNQAILDTWAQRYQVSARDAFGLIASVGEDCAGAVQFVLPERLEEILTQSPPKIDWLDEDAIAQRLRTLHRDPSAWRYQRDAGQFSLAGAQPKIALLRDDGRWGIPSGRIPTTHILKPPVGNLAGRAENEHFCLELGRALGLPTADSTIRRFRDEIAIVVGRYDRAKVEGGWVRIHQEDMCQASGVPPFRKYQNQGGPGIRSIVELLRANSRQPEEDVRTFVDSIGYNWLIAGTDAHAKNYSLLISARSVRLAPLYDILTILPYPAEVNSQDAKLAMKIGDEYRLRYVRLNRWQRMADELRIDADALIGRLNEMIDRIPDQASIISRDMQDQGLTDPIIDQLTEGITARAARCRTLLS